MVTTTENLKDNIAVNESLKETSVNPAVTLSISSGPAKTLVVIKGTGFTPLTPITFAYDNVVFTPNEGAITSDGSGNFTCSYTIPVATVGAKTFNISDGISDDQHPTFTITGVYAFPLSDADAFTKDKLKAYKYGEVDGIIIDTSALATVLAIDMRGCSELMIQLINTHGSIALGYAMFGTCIESDTPPAYSAANYSAVPTSTGTITNGNNIIKTITDNYSWIVIQLDTQTPGSNSQASILARQKQ